MRRAITVLLPLNANSTKVWTSHLLTPRGAPVAVLAAQRGTVDRVDFSAQGYGNYIRIVHEWNDDRYVTWYGHLTRTNVRPGDFVLAGQKIGISGTTGFSSGIHLHLTLQHIGHGLAKLYGR